MKLVSFAEADLAIVGVTHEHVVFQSLTRAVAAFAGSIMFVLALSRAGLTPTPVMMIAGVLGAAGACGTSPSRRLQKSAQLRRLDMESALAGYLDLVNVLLAGGAGMETALLAAADAGDGWCFELFRTALTRARSSRVSFWNQFRELGDDLGVASLIEVAQSVQLAGEHGSRVRTSLVSKASALRARQLATIEYSAQQSTEKMGVPMVMLFIGFILLVGYPAFASTIGVL